MRTLFRRLLPKAGNFNFSENGIRNESRFGICPTLNQLPSRDASCARSLLFGGVGSLVATIRLAKRRAGFLIRRFQPMKARSQFSTNLRRTNGVGLLFRVRQRELLWAVFFAA